MLIRLPTTPQKGWDDSFKLMPNVERNLPRTDFPSIATVNLYAVTLTHLLTVSLLCVLREAPLQQAPTRSEPR